MKPTVFPGVWATIELGSEHRVKGHLTPSTKVRVSLGTSSVKTERFVMGIELFTTGTGFIFEVLTLSHSCIRRYVLSRPRRGCLLPISASLDSLVLHTAHMIRSSSGSDLAGTLHPFTRKPH
ncbi:uncharacterized protein LOC124406978 [Diprion similis]|uniref:uncharacterized protein LOC124406978 n=1 Tax=Diprion similis TaxID=362088 RepID=UPI001EF7E375|nr:uncharacterized protein LOC124406978 [Diprion similis]